MSRSDGIVFAEYLVQYCCCLHNCLYFHRCVTESGPVKKQDFQLLAGMLPLEEQIASHSSSYCHKECHLTAL